MTSLAAGTVIAGDFRIVRPLSSGGMGAVYVALQLSTGRERALKLMLHELAGNEDLKRRFEQEAKVGSQIESEHVVEVVAAGIDGATGAPWLAMELLDGEDFATYLGRNGPVAPALLLELFDQLTHAVGAAHARGIVHRDLKLENLFLARSRRAGAQYLVKVLDFGIAKLLGAARTSATAAMGTPMWMAPEQTQPDSRISPAADVWALGLIAFHALTGKPFWRSAADANVSSVMILREVVMEPIARASDRAREVGGAPVPPGFDAWFARCVDRDPNARFQDARAMQEELRRVLSGMATHAPVPVPAWQRTSHDPSGSLPVGYVAASSLVSPPPIVAARVPPPPTTGSVRRKSSAGLLVGIGVALLAIGGGVAMLVTRDTHKSKSAAADDDEPPRAVPLPSTARSSPPPPPPPPPKSADEPKKPLSPFLGAQAWSGKYLCGQGSTELVLRIEEVDGLRVRAVFDFIHRASGSAGSYKMAGTYEPSARRLKLVSKEWIKRPPRYETVDIEGVVSADGTSYVGKILNPSCGAFDVHLGP